MGTPLSLSPDWTKCWSIMDGRNIWPQSAALRLGFNYHAIACPISKQEVREAKAALWRRSHHLAFSNAIFSNFWFLSNTFFTC